MQVVQVVKRFGPVGGMEEYVFQLSTELLKLGCEVIVLCEKSYANDSFGKGVFELGENCRTRWLSHYNFSRKVHRWLAQNPSEMRIVHSHERQSSHHVTTFHTVPFGHGRGPFFPFMSLRNFFYDHLERRELLGSEVKAVVPVSNHLGALLKSKYPSVRKNLSEAIHPGVSISNQNSSRRIVPTNGGTIGFIGKEWKRKGLPKVIKIWEQIKKCRPNIKLKVAGPAANEVRHLFSSEGRDFELLGYVENKSKFFESIDVLLHPAITEAFGMVITEALSLGVPVLCSTECGAAEVISERYNSSALSYQSKNEFWLNELESIFSNKKSMACYSRSWELVAHEYSNIYESIISRM